MILNGAEPIHWVWAGLAIAATVLVMLFVLNTRFGISTGLEDMCALVSRRPFFRRKANMGIRSWRVPFFLGLVLGGILSALWTGGWDTIWSVGMLDAVSGWGKGAKLAWMFAGGLLIGFGTRLATGCTSGHGIFGVSNLEVSSLVAVVTFMAAGVATTQITYRVIF